MPSVTLLGPQIREPNLAEMLRKLSLQGPYAVITAGWQEREGEVEELRQHVAAPVQDLQVYARTEELFARDAALRVAHRQRQARLHEMQEVYRLRLDHAKRAARELLERDGDPGVLRPARRQAIAALRRLDLAHLNGIRRVHAQFEAEHVPLERPAVREAIADVRRIIDQSGAVFVAGGHVAVLLNRLRLLGGEWLLSGKPVVAWSAGAMVMCEAVVLFHDQPPQGASHSEVFDAGLGLVRNVMVFPHSQTRLKLHDATRVALLSRRFAPAACYTLDAGSCLHFDNQRRLVGHLSTWQLSRRGALMAAS
jgi:peptidase E